MKENYIISGFGHALGTYKISNRALNDGLKAGYLDGFDEERMSYNKGYREFLPTHPGVSPFDYFVENKMGFKTRNYVMPFPFPTNKKYCFENSLDLGVNAIDAALQDADISPGEIGAWFVSTVSPPELAPGLAATIKSYFVNHSNQSATLTLTSGCCGFNINLQLALECLTCNPGIDHVVVTHTETMTSFLRDITEFSLFVTFGDAAAAVVLSRKKTLRQEGFISIVNHQDPKMIDFVGVNKKSKLHLNNQVIKERGIANLFRAAQQVLKNSNWNADAVDLFIPHQTGDSIIKDVGEKLGIPGEKLYRDVQVNHGNLSGSGVGLGLSLLKHQDRLAPGFKLLSSTVGVGGEFGAFTYIVPENNGIKPKKHYITRNLEGKTAVLTGSTGGLGTEVAKKLAQRGCRLILHYNANEKKAQVLRQQLEKITTNFLFFKADFANEAEVETLIRQINRSTKKIDYLVHIAGVPGSLSRPSFVSYDEMEDVSQTNLFAPIAITKGLKNKISGVILYVGSGAEDAQFSGSSAYVVSKKGLHGFAARFSEETNKAGIRSIYYMPGLLDKGMTDILDGKAKSAALYAINQPALLKTEQVAERIVRSLYIPKVLKVDDRYEGSLLVRRDGYRLSPQYQPLNN
ncbi:MAG: SDR family NAD(P)-dependent oxidoreductase [Candidatus Aminicenantes bacterium]|jgi:3-oxoacyl-[acyl-carrier protein] reductase